MTLARFNPPIYTADRDERASRWCVCLCVCVFRNEEDFVVYRWKILIVFKRMIGVTAADKSTHTHCFVFVHVGLTVALWVCRFLRHNFLKGTHDHVCKCMYSLARWYLCVCLDVTYIWFTRTHWNVSTVKMKPINTP